VRAVGSAMKKNPVSFVGMIIMRDWFISSDASFSLLFSQIPLIVPCHRVLRSSGDSGSYMGGKGDDIKVWLLTHEKKALELNASQSE